MINLIDLPDGETMIKAKEIVLHDVVKYGIGVPRFEQLQRVVEMVKSKDTAATLYFCCIVDGLSCSDTRPIMHKALIALQRNLDKI